MSASTVDFFGEGGGGGVGIISEKLIIRFNVNQADRKTRPHTFRVLTLEVPKAFLFHLIIFILKIHCNRLFAFSIFYVINCTS